MVEGFKVLGFLSPFLLSLPSPRPHVQLRVSGQGRIYPGLKNPMMPVPDVTPSCTRLLIHNGAAQVLTAVEEFALVRDKLHELGQPIDHDQSGLVYTPLTNVEVCPAYPWLQCPALEYKIDHASRHP